MRQTLSYTDESGSFIQRASFTRTSTFFLCLSSFCLTLIRIRTLMGTSVDQLMTRWAIATPRTAHQLSSMVVASCCGAALLPVVLVQKKDDLWTLQLDLTSAARQLKHHRTLIPDRTLTFPKLNCIEICVKLTNLNELFKGQHTERHLVKY